MGIVLITGGVYQGKLDYALKRFNAAEKDIYRVDDVNTDTPGGKKIIYEIDKWILAMVKDDMNVGANIKELIAENKNAVVICNDISSGIVPVDPVMRKWRDEVGRAMALLAKVSDEVIRLFCGIPQRIS